MLRAVLLGVAAVTASLIAVHIIGFPLRPKPILYFLLLSSLSVGFYFALQRIVPEHKITPIWQNATTAPRVNFKGPDVDDLIDTEFQYPLIKPSQCTEKPNDMIIPIVTPPATGPTCQPSVTPPAQLLPDFTPANHQYVCSRPQLFSWNREDAELVQDAAAFHPS